LVLRFEYDFAELNNKTPMIDFLEIQSIAERAAIYAAIEKLVELKNLNLQPKNNLSKYLEDGIFELRVILPGKTSRCLYYYEINKKIIFTHGFIKKSKKTPRNEIEKAKLIRHKLREHNDKS
jgi:phage-related protein